MSIIERPVRMPRLAFLAVWSHEKLGEPPVVVEHAPMYMTDDFSEKLRVQSFGLLAQVGLASSGTPSPRLRGTLELLAGARREVYAWSHFGNRRGDNGAVLVAAAGREAVRLVTDTRSVQIEPVSPRDISASLVELLPDCQPAPIRPLRVPKDYYDSASADPLAESSASADQLRHLMRAERDAVHQMHVAVRDHAGERTHSTALSAIDLADRGRILSFVNQDDAGELHINVYSGTRARLVEALALTLSDLA
ncbi:ESX secretion-associated protein EspG [Amycolatopsis benzoatilytica]|uniref:ESX secretion-associated protein EspG n=1 Tax=Amycolatopsis benzoatilytica TaxID=346045 RepID=UPI00036F060E|nr:ESX secretion-associated protein EspG [Amycolatopsis benzoatilytica]